MKQRAALAFILTAPAAIAAIFVRNRKRAAGNNPHWIAVMSGSSTQPTAFAQGFATAIMGGIELDLRHATLDATPATLDVAVFGGGLLLRVPDDWQVTLDVHRTMGGVRDYRATPSNSTATPDLIVVGSVLMGGLAIAGDIDLADLARNRTDA